MRNDAQPVAPLAHAWVSTSGATAARNYDEFQNDDEITEIITRQPTSILAVEMPQCAPEMRASNADRAASLRFARTRLAELKDAGELVPYRNIIFLYEIRNVAAGTSQLGIGAMVSTTEIWDQLANPHGRVIRNEDVFASTVEGRKELIAYTGHLCSAVTLATEDGDGTLQHLIGATASASGAPTVTARDHHGYLHQIWVVEQGPAQQALLAALRNREFVVADGNHRSLAAQQVPLSRFLAIIMCAETMTIGPYNRLIQRLGMTGDTFLSRLRAAGITMRPLPDGPFFATDKPHHLGLYIAGQSFELIPLLAQDSDVVAGLDHQLVETQIIRGVLGIEPADERIAYVGADYGLEYLMQQVDSGSAECAILIPAVRMADFMEVNRQRKKMPRKSTWFTPKVLTGLVIVESAGL